MGEHLLKTSPQTEAKHLFFGDLETSEEAEDNGNNVVERESDSQFRSVIFRQRTDTGSSRIPSNDGATHRTEMLDLLHTPKLAKERQDNRPALLGTRGPPYTPLSHRVSGEQDRGLASPSSIPRGIKAPRTMNTVTTFQELQLGTLTRPVLQWTRFQSQQST
jgi:hypothetical protein